MLTDATTPRVQKGWLKVAGGRYERMAAVVQ